MSAKIVKLLLHDGTPNGLITTEIMSWTGSFAAAPRTSLAALLKRDEVRRTGVYVLLGDDPENPGGAIAYIGESDDVSKRLSQHAQPEDRGGKDFWTRAVTVTNKDPNVTKAHVRYLESRLITLALQANSAKLINGTAPEGIKLPEADKIDMESFLDQIQLVMPLLSVNIFSVPKVTAIHEASNTSGTGLAAQPSSPIFELKNSKQGFRATAREVDGEFTVLAGSTARDKWIGGDHNYKNLRDKLEREGVIVPSPVGNIARFTRNYVFASTSAAAAVVTGRNANGRVEWSTAEGLKYGDWQSQGLEEALEAPSSTDS